MTLRFQELNSTNPLRHLGRGDMRRQQLVRVATACGLAVAAVAWLATVPQAQTARA